MAKAKQKPSHQRAVITRRRNEARRIRRRRESADGRLNVDGASSPQQINRRLLWLSIEWQLEAPPKVGRTASEELAEYCSRHHISFDWMLSGCLHGLKRMTDARRGRAAATSPSSLRDKLSRLSESEWELVLKTVEGMLPEGRL